MVDVDLHELVDKCLANLQKPGNFMFLFQYYYICFLCVYILILMIDEKLARIDVDTIEFWVDRKFNVLQQQRKFTSTT
jgi:hypothetical protein